MLRAVTALAMAVSLFLPGSAAAEGSLFDRVVTFSTLTYDTPKAPLYVGRSHTVIVTDAVEFGLHREGVQNGLDVVPVSVNISATRIEVDFSRIEPGAFAVAKFNGYVLTFVTDCVLFRDARVDPAATTLPLAEDAVHFDGGTATINVAGLSFDQKSHIAVDLDVADCPLS